MGYEYELRFAHPGSEEVTAVIERLPFARAAEPAGAFELRQDDPGSEWPDATVHLEHYGLYYCDHGGAGRELLGKLLARLTNDFGPVTVAELE